MSSFLYMFIFCALLLTYLLATILLRISDFLSMYRSGYFAGHRQNSYRSSLVSEKNYNTYICRLKMYVSCSFDRTACKLSSGVVSHLLLPAV